MGDVMHLKRQTVVERLKRRFDHYRRHHNSCLPKYEQATSALYETQRQDTLLLKQRFLESKAKKAKTKSDHHRVYKEPSAESKSQLQHSKPLKRSAEDHPHPTSTPDAISNEDSEKPPKMARQATPDLPPPPQSSLPPTFSVQQIVQQQFSSKQGGSPAAATPPHPVECKQEKEDSDLCQFQQQQQQDRLPDCLVEFSDEAGDNELSLEPEQLKALYEELLSNPAGLPDFNLEDSVGSVKDSDEKDIMDLVKGQGAFQNGLSFANSPGSQQNGLFDSIPTSSDASMSPLSVTTTSTSAGFYTGPSQQRLPSYGSPNMSHSNGLVLDFKMSEPSPAALTLKQMAEQHQNMQQKQQQQQQQQQQMVNPTQMNNRSPAFNQESFSSHLNNLRPSNFLNGSSPAVQTNSPKMPNSGTSMFTSFEQHLSNFPANEVMNNFPSNCEPVSPNNLFESDIRSRNNPTSLNETNIRGLQMKLSNMEQQQKPPAYNSTRPLTHFSDSAQSGVRQQNLANAQQQQQNSMNRQFQSNTGVRMQIPQVPQLQPRQRNAQQIQQEEPKQQQHLMQPHSNMYTSYSTQQQTGSPSFNATMSQALPYSNQFTSNTVMSRPPPEYKATTHHQQQHNVATDNLHLVEQLNAPSQVMFNQPTKNKFAKQQRPPNVTITPDGTAISSSHEWRTNVLGNQTQQNQFRVSPFSHQENYRSINSNVTPTVNVPLSPIYNQYRMPTNQMPNNRLSRPTNMQQNHMMVQQRQRMSVPQRPRMPSMPGLESHNSMGMNTNSMSPNKVMGPIYSEQEISRQDNSDNYLDFLDIESSASDLLSFDPVMQGPHFPILDDMDI